MKKKCPVCGCFMKRTQYEYYLDNQCNHCGHNFKDRFDDRHSHFIMPIEK